MASLIKVDYLRIFKNKLFFIGSIIASVFSLLLPLLYFGISKLDEGAKMYAITPTYSILQVMPVGFILALFFSIIAGQEYSFGTIRNKIIIGKKRSHIYFSIFLTTSSVFMAMMIATGLLTSFFSILFLKDFFPQGFDVPKFFMNIGFITLAYLAISSLILLFSLGLNKVALSIIFIGAGSAFLGSILPLILAGISNNDTLRFVSNVILSLDYFYITGLYLNISTMSSSLGGSFGPFFDQFIRMDIYQIILTVVSPISFFVLNYFLGDAAFNKKNIK